MARMKKAIREPEDKPQEVSVEYLGTGQGGPDLTMRVGSRPRRLVPGEILKVPRHTAEGLLRTPYFQEMNDGDI